MLLSDSVPFWYLAVVAVWPFSGFVVSLLWYTNEKFRRVFTATALGVTMGLGGWLSLILTALAIWP